MANEAEAERSATALFSIMWDALADLLGTATTAVIVHRAALRALSASPELEELEISLRSLDYEYTLPGAWSETSGETSPALRALAGALVPLLLELTGSIAVRRLENIPDLAPLLTPVSETRS